MKPLRQALAVFFSLLLLLATMLLLMMPPGSILRPPGAEPKGFVSAPPADSLPAQP
jgi:hypothetical protein